VINLGSEVEPPQRHAKQEPHTGHDPVAVADAHAGLGQVQLEAPDVLERGRLGRSLRNAANRLELRM
jgi:hypothetical protein